MKLLKKYFIPSQTNDHKPHLLRENGAAVLLGIILIAEIYFLAITFILPNTSSLANILSSVVVDATNTDRQQNSLEPLTQNNTLQLAAEAKAHDMATKGYFAHNSPEGKTPWYWLKQAGYTYSYAGENLAINFFDSKDVVDAWMNSPAHRANILNKNFTEIGIATAEGNYEGANAVFVVQFFGNPTPQASKVLPVTSATTSPKRIVQNKETENYARHAPTTTSLTLPPVHLRQANAIQAVLVSPRHTSNEIFIVLLVIIGIALLLNIIVKMRIQHPKLIARGALLVSVLIILIIFNYQLSHIYQLIL